MLVRSRRLALAVSCGLLLLGLLGWAYLETRSEPGELSKASLRLASGAAPARLPIFPPGETAQSAVVLIGDGLGFSGIEAARLLGRGIGGSLELDRLPMAGFSSTRSAQSVYTDSAAGATALATGHKTLVARLGVDEDGKNLRNLVEAAKAQGKAIGLVTDSYLWDATPAGFSVHNLKRRNTKEIALAMAGQQIDLLIGGEAKGYEADDAGGPIEAEFLRQGYGVARDLAAFEKLQSSAGPLLGLFPGGSLTPADGPSLLPRLVELALARLTASPNGYFLLIESEETDTGGHHGDLEQVVRGVLALDGALHAVLEVAEKDGKTLVIWTADHETGGLALLGGVAGEKLRYDWATEGHNAEPVPLLAYGPGAERFSGRHDNTDVAFALAKALELERP